MVLELGGQFEEGLGVGLLDGHAFLHVGVDVLQKQALLGVLGLEIFSRL